MEFNTPARILPQTNRNDVEDHDDPADPDPEEVELCDISKPDSYEERSSSYVPVQALLHRNRTITTGTGASGYTSIIDLPLCAALF